MKVLSLFSGIGAFEKALKNINQPFELVGFSEIDKYAVKSYCAIHNVSETMNLGDITKINEKALPKNIDLITYGFPCQDISLAGKQKGLFNDDGTQTRSGLFFEALRIIEEIQPKIAIAENVKNLVGKKFNAQFQVVLASLEAAGYNNYWQVLNAKDYGIPQNRERVFIVSIRKDVDTGTFKFPEGFPLELRLKDVLEDEVDEKFYLSQKAIDGFNRHKKRNKEKGNGFGWTPTDGDTIAFTLQTSGGTRPTDNFIDMQGLLNIKGNEQKVLVREATKKGYTEAVVGDSINLEQPNSKTRRGRVGHGVVQTLTTAPQQAVVELPAAYDEQNKYVRKDGCIGTLTTDGSSPKHNNRVIEPINPMPDGTCRTIKNQYYKTSKANFERSSTFGATGVTDNLRIRKLTPKECFRLMGFSDEDFAKAEAVNSNTQLYKQAGNSIVVDVIAHIFTGLKSEY